MFFCVIVNSAVVPLSMKPVTLFLVKPHPPAAILDRQTPVPESYRYNWEPIALQYLASRLARSFGDRIAVRIWHLTDRHDDELLLKAVSEQAPSIVAFGEVDILVNEVSALAGRIKAKHPGTWTVAGGKQTSLLRAGDRFPFGHVDFAFRGDGAASLEQLVMHCLSGTRPCRLPGLVPVNDRGVVAETPAENPRLDIAGFDGCAVRSVPVENRSMFEYLESQSYPSIRPGEPRTSPILIGTGCPYACSICQSPVEYENSGARVALRNNDDLAKEIVWLIERRGVNNFFSLESNMNLNNLHDLYVELEALGVHSLSLSGFVRAGDVVKARETGLLEQLSARGMRVLSIGLDVPSSAEGDIYNKSFSHAEQMECLRICESLGIIVLATAVVSPDVDRKGLAGQLRALAELPVADVDVRLAIALRNTPYFRKMENYLLLHPERDPSYFDRQNYRYQTIHIPGRITPEETYELVRLFHEQYHGNGRHREYVLRMKQNHPDTRPFFERQERNPAGDGKRRETSAMRG